MKQAFIAVSLNVFLASASLASVGTTPSPNASKCKVPKALACFDSLTAASCLATEQSWEAAEDIADDILASNVCNEAYRDGAKFFKRAVKAARRGDDGWQDKLTAEQQKVASLESRGVALAAEIKTLTDSLVKKDGDIARLETDLKETKEKDAVVVNELKEKLALAEAEKATLEKKVAEAKLEQATDRETNARTLKRLTGEMARAERRLEQAWEKLKALNVAIPADDEGASNAGQE